MVIISLHASLLSIYLPRNYLGTYMYLAYHNNLLPNGSYLRLEEDNYIYCVHSEALDDADPGGSIYSDGTPCTNTTSPLQCNDVSTAGGPTSITVEKVASFAGMTAVLKCCLPNDCNNETTDIMIANIYGK